MPSAGRANLRLREAILLGTIQGPTEWLPVSSSGHVALVPVLLGWSYSRLDPALRKSFEVALHAGAAGGLLLGLGREAPPPVCGADVARIALSAAPAGVLGLLLERPIERRLGGPRSIAAAQIAGGAGLWLADRRPAKRALHEAAAIDGLAIGVAQAAALVPGVSRTGAALTAARLRHFDRRSSAILSREAALPLILAAAALKGFRLAREGPSSELAAPFAAGGLAALASTTASIRLLRLVDRSSSLAPFAAYRAALGGVALGRLSRRRRIGFNGGHG